MSTNKRFNLVKCKGNRWGIEDNILEKEDALFFICREGQFETNGLVLLLNQLNDKNEQLEKENLDLTEELDYYKTKCASLETGYIKAEDENWRLEKSNMEFANELGKTIDENEQLKQELFESEKEWYECHYADNMTDDVEMKRILDLSKRVTELEKEIINSKREELDWALNQFRYMGKTSDQRKALAIIEKELGFKKTSLRPKSV